MMHILDATQYDRTGLEEIFKIADSLDGKRSDALKGKILCTLFYEPSTRTRLSFESAMVKLGGQVLSSENANENSSAYKGETLEDTVIMVGNYADVVVIRHPQIGSVSKAATLSKIPVINAGDGGGEHPTQALVDAYTIKRELGGIDNKKITIVGDLKHSRSIRSLSEILALFKGVEITFVSPPGLEIEETTKSYIKERGLSFTETNDLNGAISAADVIYTNRIQKERFPESEAGKFDGMYVFTKKHADQMKEGSIILNPLPRIDELTPDVDSSPRAAYFKEAAYAIPVRMALLTKLLG